MKKTGWKFLCFTGRVLRWRNLVLLAGVSLLTAGCQNNTQKKDDPDKKDSARKIERVTCYEPTVLNDSTSDTLN